MIRRAITPILVASGAVALIAAALGHRSFGAELLGLDLCWPLWQIWLHWDAHNSYISAAWFLRFRLRRSLASIKRLERTTTAGKRVSPRTRRESHIHLGVAAEITLPAGMSPDEFRELLPAIATATQAVAVEVDELIGSQIRVRLYYLDPLTAVQEARL